MPTTLVLLRDDLRLDDHPAIERAASRGDTLCVYLDDDATVPPGGAARWWLSGALGSLDGALASRKGALRVLRGASPERVVGLAGAIGADEVAWNAGRTPAQRASDDAIIKALKSASIARSVFAPNNLYAWGSADKDDGEPRRVFTAFMKACRASGDPDEPIDAPESIHAPDLDDEQLGRSHAIRVDGYGIASDHPWTGSIAAHWDPSIDAGHAQAKRFLESQIHTYHDTRNDLDPIGSSMLSPWLRFGQLSIRRLWARTLDADTTKGGEVFRSELMWREFSSHMLVAFPGSETQPIHDKFRKFPWKDSDVAFEKWTKGKTGYPVVDAAMRHLWASGWMPNRARMIVASVLTKHLLVPWTRGADWFMDTLVDADLPNNTMGWQWTAGCGLDAAPYFRIFNPITQGTKFDPDGVYVRRWVPELADRDDTSIHEPLTPIEAQALGYPAPIIEHKAARDRALGAYEKIK